MEIPDLLKSNFLRSDWNSGVVGSFIVKEVMTVVEN